MRKILKVLVVTIAIYSCGAGGTIRNSADTALKTVQFMPNPLDGNPGGDMRFVHLGSFVMGSNDQSVPWSDNNTAKPVTVEPFWILQTEVTNDKYRKFVNWVKDSIIRTALGESFDEFMIREDLDGNPLDIPKISWVELIDYSDPEVRRIIDETINFPKDQQSAGLLSTDISKLIYNYTWVNYDAMASEDVIYDPYTGQYSGTFIDNKSKLVKVENRTSFVMKESINVYPDELCWIKGLSYSYNIPHVKNYFTHIIYGQYPVVGVTWRQANAYCNWFTGYFESNMRAKNQLIGLQFRLPSEAEWEYASRGGNQLSLYPWGGPYIRNGKGCFLANFKPFRGNYAEDGAAQTAPVASYTPNDYGLYDMAGNVAEWTNDAYQTTRNFVADINPVYSRHVNSSQPQVLQRKVIRGGSWKDIGYFLQNGTRTYEYQDNTKPYIGFRYVRSTPSDFKLDL